MHFGTVFIIKKFTNKSLLYKNEKLVIKQTWFEQKLFCFSGYTLERILDTKMLFLYSLT